MHLDSSWCSHRDFLLFKGGVDHRNLSSPSLIYVQLCVDLFATFSKPRVLTSDSIVLKELQQHHGTLLPVGTSVALSILEVYWLTVSRVQYFVTSGCIFVVLEKYNLNSFCVVFNHCWLAMSNCISYKVNKSSEFGFCPAWLCSSYKGGRVSFGSKLQTARSTFFSMCKSIFFVNVVKFTVVVAWNHSCWLLLPHLWANVTKNRCRV